MIFRKIFPSIRNFSELQYLAGDLEYVDMEVENEKKNILLYNIITFVSFFS